MKLYDLLTNMYETSAIVNITVSYGKLNYSGELKELKYAITSKAEVCMFKAVKKNTIKVWATIKCETIEEFEKLTYLVD